ncbi:multiple monosaccharide ABC transporter substrate-binding protein [Caproiciproducens galactitolivorans]|uniref:Sugar ABC transporter substrate-binding protein n=1 Tax=Caproiciproducens galactitolivorans TaxID=642589 RepID=A0ABT4BSX3_9FIRM|nr:multiple monosaccharide ABC transporter substrate-binding protein [Caproiciproducens galactitolivorans]MCY1713954.1 sugar ABC transporter substrate-binding protein [Caproiciproducens galactitolivorans]
MKKILSLILSAVLVLSMVGCSGQASKQDTKEASKQGSGSAEKFVGVCMPEKYLQRWVQDGDNMKKVLEEKGYKVEIQYANNDVNTQVSQIENMITSGVKVLVIASIDGSALTDALKQASDSGVKVIAYDRLIMNSPNVDYYATFDNYKVGQLQGQYIENKLGLREGKGPFNIEIFSGSPDDNNAKFFYNGAMDVLRPYITSQKLVVKSNQVEFAKCAIQGWKAETAQSRMDNLLSANYAGGTKLDAVLAPNDAIARGAMAALKNIGYGSADKPYPVITGQDCEKSNVASIAKGEQSMSVFKDTRTLANKVASMVDALMQGKEAEVNDQKTYNNGAKVVPSYLCDPVAVTKENYDKVLVESGYYTKTDLGL